jgi:hypothetical protein
VALHRLGHTELGKGLAMADRLSESRVRLAICIARGLSTAVSHMRLTTSTDGCLKVRVVFLIGTSRILVIEMNFYFGQLQIHSLAM